MRFEAAASEDRRQAVHVLMGGFALALPYLPWWQAVALAAAAVVFNLLALERLFGGDLFRPGERFGRASSGIVLYPMVVLGMLLVFPSRPDIVAGAWGILAAGDGMATIVGRRLPIRRIPWNRQKSLGGSITFALAGGVAGGALAWWCRDVATPIPYLWYPFVAATIAAIAAAAVETLPISLDDNISVAATAAGAMWVVSLVSEEAILSAALGWIVPVALATNAVVAFAGYRARTVTGAGAVTGAILGFVIMACTGVAGWVLLLATFGCAVLSSRLGLQRKMLLGIAEERGGRRGTGNAIANTGVAAIAAVLAATSNVADAALLAFVAALAAGGSDTVASEIGKAWGRTTWLVTSLERVKPGTPGAISLEGTAAGAGGAVALGAIGLAGGLISLNLLLIVVLAATAGAFVESFLGATLEPRGMVNNDVLNFINTAVAAGVAVQLMRFV